MYKFLLLIILPLTTFQAAAQLHKCRQLNDNISFQNSPCLDGQQEEILDLKQLNKKITSPLNQAPQSSPNDNQERINKIKNPGFNKGINFWHGTHDPQAFQHSTRYGNSLLGAVKVRSIPPKNPKKDYIYQAALSQCIELGQGKEYRFAASFKSIGKYLKPHSNRVNLYWYQSSDCTTKGQFGAYLEPETNKNNWHRLVLNKRKRSLNAQSARIEIKQSRTSGDDATAFWDDIELTPVTFKIEKPHIIHHQYTLPKEHNYLKNPDFIDGLNNWRHSGDTQWVYSEGFKALGAARLGIFSKQGGYGADSFSQCVNIGAHKIFTLGATVKVDPTSTQKGGGIFRLNWYENLNCTGRSQAGFKEDRVDYKTGWQQLNIESIEVPKNTHSASIYFTRGVRDSGLFAYFIDDVYFKAISNINDLNIKKTEKTPYQGNDRPSHCDNC